MTRHFLLLSAAVLALCSGQAAAGKKAYWQAVSSTRFYSAIPAASDDTVNPLRGYHRWQNQELVPQAESSLDSFRRYYWRDLESAEGQYNFSVILDDIRAARTAGRKHAIRLRMMAGYDDDTLYAPAYLMGHPRCAAGCGFWGDADPADPGLTWVPDWNDPYLHERARALLAALSQAIVAKDSIAWIDVGLYGQYGEWALRSSVYTNKPAAISTISDASKREFARMHFETFPNQQFVMFVPYANKDALEYGLFEQTITSQPVGLRLDCLGRADYFNQWTHNDANAWPRFATRWQSAPFVAEFCPFTTGDSVNGPASARSQVAQYHISTVGNANFNLGYPDAERFTRLTPAEQEDLRMLGRDAGYRYSIDKTSVTLTSGGQLSVGATIANRGNAPTYEPWKVQVELTNSSAAVVWSAQLPVALGTLHGGGASQAIQASWSLPALPVGTYSMRIVARDARPSSSTTGESRRPLRWTVSERASDGSLVVGQLVRR